ncbi:MAG TPA: HNH endonuclease signature motif containing protein, partial [Steroidobacteraceae bacterium]|nr:HNH endonuclease signature motif containing protein [Steroidobacteraceae bacterium]
GGETKLSNLVTLCRFHHRQVHEGRVIVTCLDDGAIRFTRPDATTFDSPMPRPTGWRDLVAKHSIRITPQTAITGWTGETLDVDHAVDWLLRHGNRVKNVSAETLVP